MRPQPITVRETIHHGDYRNVRTFTIEQTWAAFIDAMKKSPYPLNPGEDKNPYVAREFARLLIHGVAEIGWARLENTERCMHEKDDWREETHSVCRQCGECDE